MGTVDEEHAIGITELAAMLGVSTDTAYTLVRSGDVPAFRVGRLWRVWPTEVRAALAAPADSWARSGRSESRRRLGKS